YTQFLLEELAKPAARIEDVFKRVRLQVRQRSRGQQIPWESTSLEEDFSFDTGKIVALSRPDERAREQEFNQQKTEWNSIKESKVPDDFFAFLKKYPSGFVSEQAQFRLDQVQKSAVEFQASANGVIPLASGTDRYAVGDEFVYERIDGFTKAVTRETTRVTFASNDRVELNGGQEVWDQMGGQILSRYGRKEPASSVIPADLSVGKRWRTAYTNTSPTGEKSAGYYDLKVVALEEIVVPAGRFMAFKIERTGELRGQGWYTVQTGTNWIDPLTMQSVRNDSMSRRDGRISVNESFVLLSMKRVPRQKS
ncbi:MAG: hypothetical protein ABIR26_17220, partial [Ramlibacter sp.]